MPSPRYTDLQVRIEQLRRHMMPRVLSPIGNYTKQQYDKVRGFRLLVHAEMESYIEDRAKSLVAGSYQAWQADRVPRSVLLNLVSYTALQSDLSKTQLKAIYGEDKDYLCERIEAAVRSYHHALSQNHGIREDNILQMLLPIGFRTKDIDPAWLGTLDSFGRLRGETAHTSFRVQQPLDPSNELTTVTTILSGLLLIDEVFDRL